MKFGYGDKDFYLSINSLFIVIIRFLNIKVFFFLVEKFVLVN